MALANGDRHQDRLKAAVGVAAFHALLGYAFVTGLAVDFAHGVADDLKIFDVPEAPPPPPADKSVPAKVKAEAPEGAASPPSLTAKATPLVAPPPKVQLDLPPPPIVTSPKPAPALGNDRSTGASDIDGPGTGSGGEGAGTGSGGRGSGTGGGIAERAKRVSGSISGATDYPRAARRGRIEGSVSVRFTVGIDGSVSGCRVTRSSANDELEATTCRLVERRFRYEPARNAEGRPVPEVVSRTFDWLLPFRN
jgi:protein TonB